MNDTRPQPRYRIRAAELSDWEILADFNRRLAAETEDKQLDPETVAAGVQSLLANPERGRYFVADAGGAVIGQVMHTKEWSDWRNGDIWWLQSVYVVQEHRRAGVFRALFDHIRDLARDTPGVVGLRLYVEHQNAAAQEVYRRLGMQDGGYQVMELLS